jgi:copper(I)-binding protein
MLAPNGYHVMLMDVTRDFYPGGAIPVTLTFAYDSEATIDITVAALVTDDPPADESILLILDNRGDQSDSLIGAANPTAQSSELREDRAVIESIEVPPHTQTILAPEWVGEPERVEMGRSIRLNGLQGTLTMAFPLELWFASGRKLIVPVYVREAAAD